MCTHTHNTFISRSVIFQYVFGVRFLVSSYQSLMFPDEKKRIDVKIFIIYEKKNFSLGYQQVIVCKLMWTTCSIYVRGTMTKLTLRLRRTESELMRKRHRFPDHDL